MKILIFLSIVLGFFLTSMEFSQGANLAIRKSGPSSANPGELVTYTITYSNTASTLENNVVITDYLPDAANCSYYSSFPSGVYDNGTNSITWNSAQISGLAHLDAGSGENTIQVILRVGKLGEGTDQSGNGYYLNASSVTLNSYATIKSVQTTTEISSNTVSTTVNYDCTFKISQPGAGIKSATGSTLTYLVALTNTGNVPQKYSLASTLHSGQYLDQFIQDLSGDIMSVTPFIAPGGTYFFHYVLRTPNGTKPNEFTETKITAIPNICGDSQNAIYRTFIYGGTYSSYELLSVYKIDTSDPVQSGHQLTYQIVISNVGSSLTNVRLEEIYPANTSFVSASSSAPSVTTGDNTWDFATLPSGNTIITVTLDVANGLPNGTILSNTVKVSNAGTVYDTYTEQTTVTSAPDLAITKTASIENSMAGPGSIVNYTLIYTNNGNYPASGIVIKDNYDEDYMNIDEIGAGINAGGEITWNIPVTLNPGKSDTIHYSMIIKNNPLLFINGSTNIINSAIISSNLSDSNVSDNTATTTVNVFVLPDLKIEKAADPAIGLVNQPITYTLSVSNIGKLNHTGSTYTVVDYLPSGTTYLSSTPSGGIYNDNAGTISWTMSDDLPVDETKIFTVTLDALPCSLVGNGTLTNNAAVSSNLYGDADNSNNEVILITDVVDKENPTISSPDPISVNNDSGKCSAEVTLTVPVTADNCEILSVTNDHASTTFPVGTTTVKWTVTDIHGNVSTANQSVIVNDVSAPVANVETLPTITGECSVIVPVPTATDNCEGIIMGTTEDALIYFVQGTYTIHWTYDDGNGNTSSQTQTVVVKDITPPEMPILADVIVGECGGTPPTPSTVDNCAGIVMGKTSIIFPKTKQGKSTIIWTFDDGNGNVTSAYQNLIVDDITAPVADQETLPTVTGECSVSISAPTATDNCEGIIMGTTEDPTTYTIQGNYTIHWLYDDGNGNTSTQTQMVVVDDITPPVMPILADVIVGECSGTPEAPTTTDNCLGTVTGTTTTEFPITSQGTTVVTWSFDDGNGNVIAANQNVMVIDNTPPVITGTLAALTVEGCDVADVTAPVTTVSELEAWGITVSDACTADDELIVTSNDVYTGVSPLIVIRTYILTDAYDNSTTSSQSIMVVDSKNPTITLASPLASYPSDNGLCTYKVTGTQLDPLSTADNCSVKSVTNNFNNSSSLKDAKFPTGVTKVIWTVEDTGGNKTSASYDVVVVDRQNPEIVCAKPSTSYPSDLGVCTYKVPGTDLDPKVTTDNCSVKSITNDFNKASSLKDAVFPIGTTKVTWTVEDVNGNKTTCISDIVVVDTQNPAIQCAKPTIDYTYQTAGTELDPIVTDNCGVASIVNDFTNSASLQGAKFQPGTNVVKWTATDHSGNKTSCSITIEVADILPPTINCAPIVAAGYAADQGVCTYSVMGTAFDPEIEDNYSAVDITNNFNHRASLNAAQFPLGETTVIWTATDQSGNSSTCTQIIKVNDTQKPTITAPANLTVKADAGKCTASALILGTPVTTDNCTVASVSNNAPEIFPLGQTVVTWTVTDNSGNTATSAQTIVVERLPIAVDDAVSLKEDAQVSGNVMANDAGLCNVPIQVKSHSEPAHGELTMADNGDFTYIPDDNYHGTDKFTYQICGSQSECSEATVTITVESVNDLPIATEDKHSIQLDLVLQGDVSDNDMMSGDGVNVWTIVDQPTHGTILFHPDGTYTYTPSVDFLGSDSFTYKLCDADGDCSQAKVSIRIEDVLLPNQILTPNGDDVNDTFIIVGIDLYPQNKLTMYNRWGNIVYQKNNYQNEWDGNSNVGKIGSKSLPVGTYYYLIDYGNGRHKTGFVYLDR